MGSLPKNKKKNIPKSIHEMSEETLRETLNKKRECNAKALKVVEKLCEEVDEDWFLANLQFINQCHFEDATIERAITRVCGYPLCQQKLEKVSNQQYHISTRYNKVFDITERKNFCSNCCYKSAMHIKKQLFTGPLWFRDQENIPKYTVLKSDKSSIGEEVILLPDKVRPEPQNEKKTVNTEDASNKEKSIKVKEKKQFSLDVKNDDLKVYKKEKDVLESTETKTLDSNKSLLVDNRNVEFISKPHEYEILKNTEVEANKINITCGAQMENKVITIISNKGKTLREIGVNLDKVKEIKTKTEVNKDVINIVQKVEKCIFEWFSLDTLFYLFGEKKLKELFQDKAETVRDILKSKTPLGDPDEKLNRLIQLYGLLEIDFDSYEPKKQLKPIPDYSILKEEGKNLEIKVRAFYQGQLEVKENLKENKEKENLESCNESEPVYLPLIDAHAQNTLRRKIVLDKLNLVIPELSRLFSLDFVFQMNEVRNLISTFTLSSHNITFKPSEWHLVGIILIKLLSVKEKKLEAGLNLESSKRQILLILLRYKLQEDYLDNLIFRLTDSSYLIEKLNQFNS